MDKPNMNNTARIKIIKSLIILVIFIPYILLIYNIYFKFSYPGEKLPNVFLPLTNKDTWFHFYGSLSSLRSAIIEYNCKTDAGLYEDLIPEIAGLAESILDLINSNIQESDFSDFFDSSENANHIYMTFLEDCERLMTQNNKFRFLTRSTVMDEATFQANFFSFIEIYLKFSSSLIRVLELAPNANDPDVLEVIKKSGEFAQRLEKIFVNEKIKL